MPIKCKSTARKDHKRRNYGYYTDATVPAGGWKGTGWNTPHGAHLIKLYRSSTVHLDAAPSSIWNVHPDLYVVCTRRFADFVNRCCTRFKQDQENFITNPFNEHDAASFNNQDSSDDKALILERTERMEGGEFDNYGEDTPGVGESPRPLLPWAATNESETQTHLLTSIKIDDVHVQDIAVIPGGTNQETLIVKRSTRRVNWLIISFNTPLVGTQEAVAKTLDFLSERDPARTGFHDQTATKNGGTDLELQEKNTPRTFHIQELPQAVHHGLTSWRATLSDMSKADVPGLFKVQDGAIVITLMRQDKLVGMVTKCGVL